MVFSSLRMTHHLPAFTPLLRPDLIVLTAFANPVLFSVSACTNLSSSIRYIFDLCGLAVFDLSLSKHAFLQALLSASCHTQENFPARVTDTVVLHQHNKFRQCNHSKTHSPRRVFVQKSASDLPYDSCRPLVWSACIPQCTTRFPASHLGLCTCQHPVLLSQCSPLHHIIDTPADHCRPARRYIPGVPATDTPNWGHVHAHASDSLL